MYIQHVDFEVVPEKLTEWQPYLRNYLAVQARQRGGVFFRVLRDLDRPYKYISLRTWLTKADALRAGESAEAQLAGKPARDGGFYAGRPAVWAEYEIADLVWGTQGPEASTHAGLFVHHLRSGVGPGKFATWLPYGRNFLSVMARQRGVVSVEILRNPAEPDRFVALRTYADRQSSRVGPEFEPTVEVQLVIDSGKALGVYEGAAPVVYSNLELYDAIWGQAGPGAYDAFMRCLGPV